MGPLRLGLLALGLLFAVPAGSAETQTSLQQGLTVYLPMETDLKDHAAAPHAVEVSGEVVIKNHAAWFEGLEDWLELPFVALNDRPFAVSVWLQPLGEEPTYGILEQRDQSAQGQIFHLMIRDGLRPWFGFYMNDLVSPLSLTNTGGWQHLVFQYDGANQQIWINGSLICQRQAEAYHGTKGTTALGKTPQWSNVPSKDYKGWMSDFRIYDRTLTFEEIVQLASATPRGGPPKVIPSPRLASTQRAGSVAPAGTSKIPKLEIDGAKLRLHGTSGEAYIVESSEDLIHWVELGTLPLGPDGFVDFVDEGGVKPKQRFYRIRYRVAP